MAPADPFGSAMARSVLFTLRRDEEFQWRLNQRRSGNVSANVQSSRPNFRRHSPVLRIGFFANQDSA